MRPRYALIVLACAAASLPLASCTRPLNARPGLGTLEPTSTFRDQTGPIDDQPEDRARWRPVVVVAPIDGVRHGASPRIVETPHHSDPPREYGLYPTPESSIELTPESWGNEVAHTGVEAIGSILALFDPRFWGLAREKPWSPREVWKRTPAEGTWSSGTPATGKPERDQEPGSDDE